MARVTQQTEYPGKYQDKFDAIKKQMMKKEMGKKWEEKQIDVMIKNSLIMEANDKINFSLEGQIKRGIPAKKGMSDEEFEKEWRKKMKARLMEDGYPFTLTVAEETTLKEVVAKRKEEATREITETTAAALKKILTTA